jgi:hypothetical protein
MKRETASFVHSVFRTLLLSLSDIEQAVLDQNGSGVLDAVDEGRLLIATAFAKTTKELFSRAFYERDAGKKMEMARVVETLQGLEVHKQYLIDSDLVQDAVFLSDSFGYNDNKRQRTAQAAPKPGSRSFSFSSSSSARFARRPMPPLRHAALPSAPVSNLQRQLHSFGEGAKSTASGDRNPNYKGNNYNPNYQSQSARLPSTGPYKGTTTVKPKQA